MISTRGSAKLCMLTVGLGIGAAVAPSRGIAAADGLDFQISIDGHDLLPTTDNSATAVSGTGDFAIALGHDAEAAAHGSFGDGAIASGNDAAAFAGGTTGETFDTAVDIGNNARSDPDAPILPPGHGDGACAGDVSGSSDTAIAVGYRDFDVAGLGSHDDAFSSADSSNAEAGGSLTEPTFTGNHDIATVSDHLPGSYSEYPCYAEAEASDAAPGNSDVAVAIHSPGDGASIQGVNDMYSLVSPFTAEPRHRSVNERRLPGEPAAGAR